MKQLDVYLSNLAVANTYLHNLHWNVVGRNFKEIHEYIEAMYDEAFEYFDEVAELQKMLGETPLSSMRDYLDNATLKDLEKTNFTEEEALRLALDYLRLMEDLALEIRRVANEDDKFAIANMMEDHLADYKKHKWFLSSMLG